MKNNPKPDFRPAGPKDRGVLLKMMEDFNRLERIPWRPRVVGAALDKLLAEPSIGRVLIAAFGAEVRGYAVLGYGFDLEFGGRDAFVTDVLPPEGFPGEGHWRGGSCRRGAQCPRERCAGAAPDGLSGKPARLVLYRRSGFEQTPRLGMTKVLAATDGEER